MSQSIVGPIYAPVVGELRPYLGGPFSNFTTETVNGLALVSFRITGDDIAGESRIDFLALVAHRPGHGDFGRFLDACVAVYQIVGIWEIWNRRLATYLVRRGFRPATEVFDGDAIEGLLFRDRGL